MLLQIFAELSEVQPFVLVFVTRGNYFLVRETVRKS